MKSTEVILEASRGLRAAAEQLQREARARRQRGELGTLDFVDVRRQCVQPLLSAAAALLVARDAELARELDLHVGALDRAVVGIATVVAQTSTLSDLVTFGRHLAGAASALVAVANHADLTRLADAVSQLDEAVAVLNPDGGL